MSAVPFILPDKKRTSKKARLPAELKGFVERVTFHNPENGFSVLRVSDKKHWGTDTVVGFASPVSAGLSIHATGRWQSCEDGHQLRAEVIRTKLPTETDDIQKCLGSGLVEGIGPAYAERFMETFGGKIFDILDKHPEKLLKVEGVGQKRCDLIARSWTEQKAVRNAVNFLIDHEVSSELAVKIVRTYGIDTVRIVKEDPYRLARDLRRIDFHWADAFAKRIGIRLHSAVRARAGLAYVLNELSTGMGNTFLPRAELEAMTCELLGVPKRVVAKAIDEALERGDVAVSDVPKPGSIYPAELLRAEEGVATEIARLTSGSLPWGALDLDGGIAAAQAKLGFEFTPPQRNALVTALTSKVSVLSGGPGMGKASILKTILSILDANGVKFRLCAPSRNAADRLAEVMGRVATGVPSLLEYNYADGTFRRNAENPVDCDLLIVNESNLLDITFAHRLLVAVPSHAAVLFVGDSDLLPSYGPGNFFSDLIDSQIVPVSQLTDVVREGPASWIAKVAHQIKSGEMPTFPSKTDDGNCYFLRVDDEEELSEALKDLILTRLPDAYRIDRKRDLQLLTPMSCGKTGAQAFNALFREDLTGLTFGIERFGQRFDKGEKVMQVVENRARGTYTGDVGVITEIDRKEGELYVRYGERIVCYAFEELDELVQAYAVTVDKVRGNEFPGVIIPLSMEQSVVLRREVLYTAVTRGQKLVVFVGDPEVLAAAVKRTDDHPRRTGLFERLMRGVL